MRGLIAVLDTHLRFDRRALILSGAMGKCNLDSRHWQNTEGAKLAEEQLGFMYIISYHHFTFKVVTYI